MRHRRRPKSKVCRFGYRSTIGQAVTCLAACLLVTPVLSQDVPPSTEEDIEVDPTDDSAVVPGWTRTAPQAYVQLGFGHTDNLNRDSAELQSGIGALAVGFAGRTDKPRLRGALAADLEYRWYGADELSDEEDDEVLGSADGKLELHAVPDRILWDFRFGFGQVRIDPLGAVGPTNRQRTASLSTGPEIRLPLGERTLLEIEGLVSEQDFEVTSELNGRLTAVRLGIERQIDRVTRITLAFDDRRTDYDIDAQTYNIETVTLEYRRQLATGEAFASIGRGRVDIAGDAEPVTVAQLAWNRAIGIRSRLELCFGQEITDAGSAFAGAGVAVGCPGELRDLDSVARTADNRVQGVVPTTNPLVRSGGSISFQISGDLGSFRATLSMAQDSFEEDPTFDNESTVLEVYVSREFGRSWRAELAARIWNQKYVEFGDENEDRSVRFALARSLGRSMRLTLSYENNRRVGGFGPFEANDYFLSLARDFGR